MRLSKNYDFEFALDLLLLQDDQIYHYVFITNILSLVNHNKQRRPRSDDKLCRNCFHICSQESYINHHNNCVKLEAAAIEMPASNADKVEFKNFNARAYAPVVIYFDLESLIIPIQSCDENPSSSWTRTLEKHKPCGFCLVLIESGSLQPVHVSIDRSSTCSKNWQYIFKQLQGKLTRESKRIASTKVDPTFQVIKLPTLGFVRSHFLMS